jgi:hypothetical protein
MMTQLGQSRLSPELDAAAKQMIQQQSQLAIPSHLGYPASPELIAAVSPEAVMVVAVITNNGRLPVTIQRWPMAYLSTGIYGSSKYATRGLFSSSPGRE